MTGTDDAYQFTPQELEWCETMAMIVVEIEKRWRAVTDTLEARIADLEARLEAKDIRVAPPPPEGYVERCREALIREGYEDGTPSFKAALDNYIRVAAPLEHVNGHG